MTAITPASAHACQTIGIHIFPMMIPLQENQVMIFMGGSSTLMVVLASMTVKPLMDGV